MVKFLSNKNSQFVKNIPYNDTDWANWLSKTAYGVTVSVTFMLICCTSYYWIIEYNKKLYGYCRCNMSILYAWFICFSNVHMIYIGSSIVGWYRNTQTHTYTLVYLKTMVKYMKTNTTSRQILIWLIDLRPLNINLIKFLILHDLHNTGVCSCFPTFLLTYFD